jgi:hypothetical protein
METTDQYYRQAVHNIQEINNLPAIDNLQEINNKITVMHLINLLDKLYMILLVEEEHKTTHNQLWNLNKI